MMSERIIEKWSVLFMLLTLLLVLISWIASVYEIGNVQSLLSAEGIRWMLGHTVSKYVQAPALAIVLVILMGAGVCVRSGLSDVLRRFFKKGQLLSRRERRALRSACLALLIYIMLIVVSLFFPWNFLQGVTGSWLHSPFSRGTVYLLSVGIGWAGMVFGYVSGSFRSIEEVVAGMSFLIARKASYFVSLFFVVQFFSYLEYTCLMDILPVSDEFISVSYQICCFLPLIF